VTTTTRPARPDWDVNPFFDREETHVPTREECGEIVFQQIKYLMEDGHSQVLGRKQALQVAAWALKIAGESDLQHHVLAELIQLPENYG